MIEVKVLTRDVVDILVPDHTILRYQKEVICTDEDRRGGFHYEFESKAWRCKRCCLLDILEDGEAPEGVDFVLEVHGYGNIL